MIDAPPPVDALSRVNVTVLTGTGDGRPDTSARVVFADASNQLVKQGLVGANGDASADMPAGGIVHVVHATDGTPNRRTVTLESIRVKPGDNITFGVAASTPVGSPVTVQGTFTPLASVVLSYEFAHPCGGAITDPAEGNTLRLRSVAGCLPATFDVLGTIFAPAAHGVTPHFVWFTATPAGGFTAPAMQEMPAFAVNVRHVPVGSAVTLRRITALPPYFSDAADLSLDTDATTDTVSANLFYPPTRGDIAAIGVVEARVSPTSFDPRLQVLRTRVAGAAASLDMDLDALPLPVIQTVPALSGKVVSWTQTGTGTPDLRAVTSSAYAAGGLSYTVRWTVIDDGTDSSVELPGLPTMFAELDPTQQPAPTAGEAHVVYVDFSNVQGHDNARRLPLGSLSSADRTPCSTAAGCSRASCTACTHRCTDRPARIPTPGCRGTARSARRSARRDDRCAPAPGAHRGSRRARRARSRGARAAAAGSARRRARWSARRGRR